MLFLVIDFCLTKLLITDSESNYQCLQLCWASKSNCQQRAGRAGRLMDGRVYRMVPRSFYEASVIFTRDIDFRQSIYLLLHEIL